MNELEQLQALVKELSERVTQLESQVADLQFACVHGRFANSDDE